MWILVNIGCIECGVSSDIVGVFDDESIAKSHQERLEETHSWREGGQNAYDLFPMPIINEIGPSYQDGADQ